MSTFTIRQLFAVLALVALQPGAAQEQDASSSASAAPPDLAGMWEPKTFGFLVAGAPLNAAGQARVEQNSAAMQSGRIMHTAWTTCRPGAVSAMTMPRENIMIMQSAAEITLLFEMPRMVRRIALQEAHPDNLAPSSLGHSSGHWEGDTLVVDTIGFNGYAELDAQGLPTSARLHTVERMTRSADGQSLDIEVTIDDPEYYSEAFTISRSWKRSENRHQYEYDCSENPREADFENAYYVHDLYRPVCLRVEGEGMALSRMVCQAPDSATP